VNALLGRRELGVDYRARRHAAEAPRPGTSEAVEVNFKLSDLNDVTRCILGFGGDVEVLGPPELRAAVAEEGRRMTARNA
jgi:predicted DNA-binding transcriptional regulator YafY